MSNGLYYCNTSRLSFGLDDVYEFNWRVDSSLAFPKIINFETKKDDFSDNLVNVTIAIPNDWSIPIKTFRYKHKAGDTGFNSFMSNAYGDLADSEPEFILLWLMQRAWTWNDSIKRYVHFAERRDNLNHPLEFISTSSRTYPKITFHSPSNYLLNVFSDCSQNLKDSVGNIIKSPTQGILQSSGIERIEFLLQLLTDCDTIAFWVFAYGDNPIFCSSKMRQLLKDINRCCKSLDIPLVEVKNESNLPEW